MNIYQYVDKYKMRKSLQDFRFKEFLSILRYKEALCTFKRIKMNDILRSFRILPPYII